MNANPNPNQDPLPVSPYTEPPDGTESPIMASIRRLMRQIEDAKPNLICAPEDAERIVEALERQQMTNMVNLRTSPFCQPGEILVAKPTQILESSEVSG